MLYVPKCLVHSFSLQADYVRNSHMEWEAVLRSYDECFVHLLLHIKPPEDERQTFHNNLLTMVNNT